jgi:Tol biopolymer transport system component
MQDEPAAIGLVNVKTGTFEKISETHAWNLQQGAMLHWNPLDGDEILYNDRQDNQIISVVMNIRTGRKHTLPSAINGLSHSGQYALSLSYGRLGRLRKAVGYEGIEDPTINVPHPDNDGVFVMDMQTSQRRLAVSISDFYQLIKDRHPELRDRHLWCNHPVFNKSDTRFFFLGRSMEKGRLETGMFTVDRDGSNLREVIPYGSSVSHFDWRNDSEIIATFKYQSRGRRHILFTDGQNDYRVLGGGLLDFDGHCTFGPDGNWLVTDRKQGLNQSLILYNVETKQGKTVVTLDMKLKRNISGHLRCDFHPRWNRTGDAICFDGIDQKTGFRQLYITRLDFA